MDAEGGSISPDNGEAGACRLCLRDIYAVECLRQFHLRTLTRSQTGVNMIVF